MRKLALLTMAVIFTAGTVFAQDNTSTVDQNNAHHSKAFVDQIGSDNYSKVLQGWATAWYITADVDQNGADNTSLIEQDNTSAYTRVNQDGDDHYAKVWQVNRQWAPNGNKQVSKITIDQFNGDGNTAIVHQNAESPLGANKTNIADIDQDGSDNYANVYQNRPDDAGMRNYSRVLQEGSSNSAINTQDGWGHTSTITSEGTNNTVVVNQSNN